MAFQNCFGMFVHWGIYALTGVQDGEAVTWMEPVKD